MDDLTRDELRVALKPTKPITMDLAVAVSEMIAKSKKSVWVPPHYRDGHHVHGYFRVNPHPAQFMLNLTRPKKKTVGMKHGQTGITPGLSGVHAGTPLGRRAAERANERAESAAVAGAQERQRRLRRKRKLVSSVDQSIVNPPSVPTDAPEPVSVSGKPNRPRTSAMRRVDRELLRRNVRRKKNPITYSDLYKNPPGSTEAEKRAFRVTLFEALMDRPYVSNTKSGPVQYDSLPEYLKARRRFLMARRAPGVSSDVIDDAMQHTLARNVERFVNGEMTDLFDRHDDKTDVNALSQSFGQWISGSFRVWAESPGFQRYAVGKPHHKTKAERATGRDIALESLDRDIEEHGMKALLDDVNKATLHGMDPEDEALVVIAAATAKPGGYRTQAARTAIYDAMARMLPASIPLDILDPVNDRDIRVDVNPQDAVLGDTLFQRMPDGKMKKLPGLTFQEVAVLLASAATGQRYITEKGGIDIRTDDDYIATMLGTTRANVRQVRSRAQTKVKTRLFDRAVAQAAAEHLDYTPSPITESAYDKWERQQRSFQEKLGLLFRNVGARHGAGMQADALRGYHNKELTLGDLIQQYRADRAKAFDVGVITPDVIAVQTPKVEHITTPHERALGREDRIRRKAKMRQQEAQRQYDNAVRAHQTYVERLDDAKANVAHLKAIVAHETGKDRMPVGSKPKHVPGTVGSVSSRGPEERVTVWEPSKARQRLAEAEKELARLKANPVSKPVKPKDTEYGDIPIHVYEAPPPPKRVRPVITPVATKPVKTKRPSKRAMNRALAEQNRVTAERQATERAARLKEVKTIPAKLDGDPANIVVKPNGDGRWELRVRSGNNRLLYFQTFDDALLGTGQSRAAAMARAKEIKSGKVVPEQRAVVESSGRVVSQRDLASRTSATK